MCSPMLARYGAYRNDCCYYYYFKFISCKVCRTTAQDILVYKINKLQTLTLDAEEEKEKQVTKVHFNHGGTSVVCSVWRPTYIQMHDNGADVQQSQLNDHSATVRKTINNFQEIIRFVRLLRLTGQNHIVVPEPRLSCFMALLTRTLRRFSKS